LYTALRGHRRENLKSVGQIVLGATTQLPVLFSVRLSAFLQVTLLVVQ
jgi:hypothetical protein